MSIAIPLEGLKAALAERPPAAYLLTVSDGGRPHAVHVAVRWDGDRLTADVGRRSAANAVARPSVSLLYPLRTPEDYSLIVDGTAAMAEGSDERTLLVSPTKAVMHRPAAAPNPDASCGADCVPLLSPEKPGTS
jgi:hypothetical protein